LPYHQLRHTIEQWHPFPAWHQVTPEKWRQSA